MNNTIKHLKNGDFEVLKENKPSANVENFTREYFINQFKQWIKTPTLKETKW